LVLDCRDKAQDLSYQIVHGLPASQQANIEQAFFRGKIQAYEDIADIVEDLKMFLERRKHEDT